jgi:hypothetical protein
MDKLSALSRGMQIMLAAGVLLLIDTFFRWQEVSGSIAGVEFSSGANAWHGFWGVVMGLLTIVLLAWVIARIAAVDIPLPVSTAMVSATVAIVIFLFALIKNLADDYSTFWSYLGVVLAAAIAVGAWLEVQEAGGVESLKSDMQGMRPASAGAGTAAASSPPPTEPPAPTPPAPPAAPSEPSAAPHDPPPPSSEPSS